MGYTSSNVWRDASDERCEMKCAVLEWGKRVAGTCHPTCVSCQLKSQELQCLSTCTYMCIEIYIDTYYCICCSIYILHVFYPCTMNFPWGVFLQLNFIVVSDEQRQPRTGFHMSSLAPTGFVDDQLIQPITSKVQRLFHVVTVKLNSVRYIYIYIYLSCKDDTWPTCWTN